jgi:hypothetical protein
MSENVWHFDTECIHGNGCYTEIAHCLIRLSKGALALANVQDVVFMDEQAASLQFDFQGKRFYWDLEVNNDWVDASVFTKFVELFDTVQSAARFTYGDLGGQSCLIGFSTPEQARTSTALTGVRFTRLR